MLIVDSHVHLLPGRIGEKVRAFFTAGEDRGAFTLAYREVPCNDCPNFDVGPNGERAGAIVESLKGLADLGAMPVDQFIALAAEVVGSKSLELTV